jgi:signal transduction histidine kinase
MDVTSSLRSLLPYGRRSIGISQLIAKLEAYLPPDEVERVQAAYDFAYAAHEGQRRRSGQPYITHPVAVADLLADLHLDSQTLMAAILHDVMEDTPTLKEEINTRFGQEVAELVDGVSKLDQIQARKRGARIEVDLPAEPPRLVCDRTMLEQVLLNLTRNGLQAMELVTDLDARVLTLRVRVHAAGAVAFSVVDAGPGIAPEVAERLFTPFFTTRGEGMGLGLSLVRTVVEQHGGSLEHGPGPGGRGTEFSFTLPARGRHGVGAEQSFGHVAQGAA